MLLGKIARRDHKVAHLSDDARRARWAYIRVYQFNGVARLFAGYGRAAPVGVEDRFTARRAATIPLPQSFAKP
jgi:hypothetical protein